MRVDRETLYKGLLEALKKKIPQKSRLASIIAEILIIEKESVYRRLRGDVHFTLCEAWTLAKELGISLDEAGGIAVERSLQGHPQAPAEISKNPGHLNLEGWENYLKHTKSFTDQPSSEIASALGFLPLSIFSPYKKLSKFFFYKWIYQFGGGEAQKKYDKAEFPAKFIKIKKEVERYTEKFSRTTYIWDPAIIENLVNDIKYFSGIHLINQEEVTALKKELLDMLDKLELIASEGKYPSSGNEVNLYVSNINIGMNYSHINVRNSGMCMYTAFIMQPTISLEKEDCRMTMDWITALKRSSVLISQSGEKERIIFFDRQRTIVGTI